MTGIIGIIVFVLDILAIVNIVKSSWTGGKKALWIILILVLPIIGLVLYYLIGKKSA